MDLKLLPNNAMTFTENQHGNAVLEKLRQQRELFRCCDVILHVNDKQFYAHRCVLSACSPFFDSLFKASKTVKEQLNINADSSDVFHILLAYMYTGTVIVDKKNVAELLKLADKFLLSKLKEYCAEYLQRYLDMNNCLTVLEMANKYGLESLQKTANILISSHISEVIEGEEILELPLLRLENFIKNSNWCLSHEELLMLISSWVHHKLKSREANFRTLLTWISWNVINSERAMEIIQEHSLFSSSRKCRSFIVEVLDENGLLCHPSYERLNTNLNARLDENVVGTDEDSDKLLNLAITTAIGETLLNEPNVDKYLMDTGRELLHEDFVSSDHIPLDPRDFTQNKTVVADFHPYSYGCPSQNVQGGSNLADSFQPNSYNSQNFEIDDFYKYRPGVENLQKSKHCLIEGLTDEQIFSSAKVGDYESHSQCSEPPPNCYHYRDYREAEHVLAQNGEKCPRMTNKVAYMNHKYDANYSNQLVSTDFSYQKNGQASDMFSASFDSNLKKENAMNYSVSEYLSPVKQESQCQSFCPPTMNVHKKNQMLFEGVSPLDSSVNLNSLGEFNKSNSLAFPSAHPQILDDVVCPENIQSPNSLPQDMSLSHLKLSEGDSFTHAENSKNRPYLCFENDVTDETREDCDAPLVARGYEDCDAPLVIRDHEDCDVPLVARNHEDCDASLVVRDHEDCDAPLVVRDHEGRYSPLITRDHEACDAPLLAKDHEECDAPLVVRDHEDCDAPLVIRNHGDCDTPLVARERAEKNDSLRYQVSETSEPIQTSEVETKGNLEQQDEFSGTLKEGIEAASTESIFPQSDKEESNLISKNSRRKGQSSSRTSRRTSTKKLQIKEVAGKSPKGERKAVSQKKSTPKESRVCDICNASFDTKKLYFSHMLSHFPGPPHQCDTCLSSFKRIYYLLDHRHTHLEMKPFKCTQCSFTSRRSFNLKEHMILHKKERPFKCEECGDTFRRKQHLVIHRTKHSNDKPYICEKCGWPGKTKNILLCHSKIHTGELYSCQYESCAYRTPKKSHLKEHMQYHTKSRPFACKICDSTFISKYHLQRHVRKHETPNLCQCPYCDYCSSRQDGMKIHIERKHSATKPKVRHRKGQLKKKDALLTNGLHKKDLPNSAPNDQAMFSTLTPNGCHLSPNSTLPPLSASLPHYPNAASPSCPFETPGDPDDPLAIVSEIEDDNQSLSSFHQGPYLAPSMGHAFSGLLDVPCGSSARFSFTSGDDLYYNEV